VAAAAAPIPLTSLSDDVGALDRALERVSGPIILTAHAYAGAVIAATRNERVRVLVFVAALAPDEDETSPTYLSRAAAYTGAASAFAQHASRHSAVRRRATPDPRGLHPGKGTKSLRKSVPSWYFLTEQDRMINPKTQELMASRMKANIRRLNVDHTPIATAPGDVVALLEQALTATPH
jgi:hypothetical protein